MIAPTMARYSLAQLPQFPDGAATLSAVGFILALVSTAVFPLLETVHALGLLSCFALLGTSRIGACIRWLSFQGILFGLVPLIAHQGGLSWRAGLLAAGKIALKGIRFPWLLIRLRARADTNREEQPLVSFVMSGLFGVVPLGFSVWLPSGMKAALRQGPFVNLA